jgi:endonuclease/exonuclease/phosphatase family metal-dependent hydrolase
MAAFINRIFAILNYIAISALLISYLAPFVSPENFSFIALFGLAYPLLLLINLFFVVFWLVLWKKKFLLSASAILAGYFIFANFLSLGAKASRPVPKKAIKIISYNVMLFDLYNWTGNTSTRNKIFDRLRDESADILCFQEFYKDDSREFNTLDTLVQLQKAKNYHAALDFTVKGKYHYGVATFSSYPIVHKGIVKIVSEFDNACIYTDIKIGADTVRVYNLQLQSIHLSSIVYQNPLKSAATEERFNKDASNIIKLLRLAFIKRAPQAETISDHIRNCPYPTIVCGDFNDTPSSYTYRILKGPFVDAFLENGLGFGATYAGSIPFLRIDYILHSSAFSGHDFRVIPEKLSDHYPISCTLELK